VVEGAGFLEAAKLLVQVYNLHLVDHVLLERAAGQSVGVGLPVAKGERVEFVLGIVIHDVLVYRLATCHLLTRTSSGHLRVLSHLELVQLLLQLLLHFLVVLFQTQDFFLAETQLGVDLDHLLFRYVFSEKALH